MPNQEQKSENPSQAGNKQGLVGYKRPPKEYQYKKGESGNPGGRVKGELSVLNEIKKMLREIPQELKSKKDKRTYLKLVVKAYFKKILVDGDSQLLKDLLDRIDGKPTETHRVEPGGEGFGIIFLPKGKRDEEKEHERLETTT